MGKFIESADIKRFMKDNRLNNKMFAEVLGVNPTFVSQIVNGKRDLPLAKIQQIISNPNYNTTALQGVQPSGVNESPIYEQEVKGIPLVPMVAMCGYLNGISEGVTEQDCERVTAPKDCDAELCISVYGESMLPFYPVGSRVFIRRANPAFIEYGKEYVINTAEGTLLKIVKKGQEPGTYELHSYNPQYDPMTIKKADIIGIWTVLAVYIIK